MSLRTGDATTESNAAANNTHDYLVTKFLPVLQRHRLAVQRYT